jgi:two-component system C4-dicarboxylate transport response regulator DctD
MTVKIVYIDDEPMLCRAFSAVLGAMNIPVETFTDAAAALAHIDANDVAAVFCDYRMPAMTGLDVLERVRGGVPFFLVSGDSDVVASVASNARVSGVLSKPYRAGELLAMVRRVADGTPQ